MAEIASAYVSLIPSARGFGRATSAQVNPQMATAGAAAGRGFGKSLLKGFLAVGIATKVTQFLGDSLGEAREAQKVGALVGNALKNSGEGARISATQVDRLSDSLSKKIAVDDEAIASTQAMLLSFKNVTRAGPGLSNIFGRATRGVYDLAAGMKVSADSATKMLGKALNDPAKGLTALNRAGVQFSAGQVERIKGYVAEGKLLRAQKVILNGVEERFKGAAESQKTNAELARLALGNLKEQIGTSLIPAMDFLAGGFANKVAPAISGFIAGLQSGSRSASGFSGFIKTHVIPVLERMGSFIQDTVIPAYRVALTNALEGARSAFDDVRQAVQRNRPQLEQLWAAARRIATVFYERVIPAIGVLYAQSFKRLATAISATIKVAAFLVQAFNTVRGAFETVRSAVTAGIAAFTQFAVSVRQKVSNVMSTVRSIPGRIKAAFSGAPSLLVKVGSDIIRGLISGIKAMAGQAAQAAVDVVKGALDKAKSVLKIKSPSRVFDQEVGQMVTRGIADGILARSKDAENAVTEVGRRLSKKAKEQVRNLRDQLSSVRSDFASLLEPVASNFTQGLFDFDNAGAFTANLQAVKGTLNTLLGNFKTLIGNGLSPGFLYRLFQEGGPSIINSLAGLDAAGQREASSLFGQVTSLADQLGATVAGSTQKGAGLENQTQRLEKKLDELIKATKHDGPKRVGEYVSGAASSGRRRAA